MTKIKERKVCKNGPLFTKAVIAQRVQFVNKNENQKGNLFHYLAHLQDVH